MSRMGYNDWSNGLFSCFGDCGSCCYASFCASCAAGEIWEKGHLSESEYAWWGGCCLYAALIENGCCCLYGIMYTGQIREKKGIDGSCFGDCMAGCFCPCCAHTRNLREVRGT